jgi:hypothetical protein
VGLQRQILNNRKVSLGHYFSPCPGNVALTDHEAAPASWSRMSAQAFFRPLPLSVFILPLSAAHWLCFVFGL